MRRCQAVPTTCVCVETLGPRLLLADPALFLAGVPDVVPEDDPYAAFDGRKGALLWAVSTTDGSKQAEYKIETPPVFDGLVAAGGRLYMATTDGKVVCMGKAE